MKIKSIRQISTHPTQLIDIGVEDDHTFFVSDKPHGSYFLTHNSWPDIDSDFSDREKAVEIIAEHFGVENVISVSNFNQLQMRSLIKDVARLAGVPFDEINKYTGKIEAEALSVAKQVSGFDRAQWVLTYDEAEANSPTFRELMEKYPDFGKTIRVLFKQMRNISRHAGGVIITNNPREAMPMIKSGGVLQTPWPEGLNARHLEDFGLLKFDILGLGTLRIFEECIRKIIRNKTGAKFVPFDQVKAWYYQNLHPDNNTMDDQKVYEHVFWNRNTAGIFQFNQNNVLSFMAEMKPKSIIDLAVATSIYRPGPLCLSGNTEILVEKYEWKNNQRHFKHKTIKQLFEERNNPVPHGRYKNTIISLDEHSNMFMRNNVKNIYKSGQKNVYKIKTRINIQGSSLIAVSSPKNKISDYVLEATLEHRFLTLEGWKQLKDINPGDYLFVINKQIEISPNYVNELRKPVKGRKNFRNIAFRNFKYECAFCDWNEASLDVNHIEENRWKNNNPENLSFMCPNHHRMYTENLILKDELLEKLKNKKLPLNNDIRMVQFIDKEYIGKEETYDIEMEAPYHNFIAGGFVVHNSIHADRMYLDNRLHPSSIHYKHPLLEEVLGDTCGLIIFQEQLQLIYHKLAGVPLEETDAVRKAFTKKDLSNKEKTIKERQAMREDFANKCLVVNEIPKAVSYNIFDEMEQFVAYSFNKAHGVCYATISYMCAWLLTYYPDEWITTYIDYCSTEKGKASGKEDPRAVALSEAHALGYEIGKPDINYSERDYIIKDKKLIPSFSSLKHIGISVLSEINEFRPYKTIEDLLFSKTIIGPQWRHSKLNKRAMATLVKLEAFESLGLVGEGKVFENYRQLYYVLVEKGEELKKAVSKKKKTHLEELAQFIEEAKELPDFTLEEKVQFSVELSGTVDLNLIVTEEVRSYFNSQNIKSIDEWGDGDDDRWLWAVVKSATIAKTKKGKPYIRMRLYGESGNTQNCFCWNFNEKVDKPMPENSLILSRFKKSDFGFSTFWKGIEIISEK